MEQRQRRRPLTRQEQLALPERTQRRREKMEESRELARGPIDVTFCLLVLLLTAIGLVMLLSASFPSAYYEEKPSHHDPLYYFEPVSYTHLLCLMRYEGLLTNDLYIPFVNVTVTVNWIVYLVFAAFVIVGCVNSVNLTDGIDGLASSVTTVVMLFFLMAAILWKMTALGIFSGALCGSLLGFFTLYNHHPAKCFMGDTGSLFLGGAVAALAFAFDMPLVLILVGIIYILETLSDIIQMCIRDSVKSSWTRLNGTWSA